MSREYDLAFADPESLKKKREPDPEPAEEEKEETPVVSDDSEAADDEWESGETSDDDVEKPEEPEEPEESDDDLLADALEHYNSIFTNRRPQTPPAQSQQQQQQAQQPAQPSEQQAFKLEIDKLPQEVQDVMRENESVANVIAAAIHKGLDEKYSKEIEGLKGVIQNLGGQWTAKQQEEAKQRYERAVADWHTSVAEKHPDYQEAATSKKFRVWKAQQIPQIQQMCDIYEPKSTDYVLRKFKKDTGWKPPEAEVKEGDDKRKEKKQKADDLLAHSGGASEGKRGRTKKATSYDAGWGMKDKKK